jgi:hypothetical protein
MRRRARGPVRRPDRPDPHPGQVWWNAKLGLVAVIYKVTPRMIRVVAMRRRPKATSSLGRWEGARRPIPDRPRYLNWRNGVPNGWVCEKEPREGP